VAKRETAKAPTRRLGAEDSKTRSALIDAAQQLMVEGGYAAVTSRRVASKAGLKPQLVHYYFRTMDDLFLAVFRRGAEWNLERQARALTSAQPLRALWELSKDPAGTSLNMEFAALANHREAIREQIATYADHFRQLQADALGGVLKSYGVNVEQLPPLALLVLMTSLSQILVLEDALGVTTGHAEAVSLVERFLAEHEGSRATLQEVAPTGRTPEPRRRRKTPRGGGTS
jgi:AcrR family transcriptional regulator